MLDKSRVEIKMGDYGTAPATALTDGGLHSRVQDYRRQAGSRMYPLDYEGIRQKIPSSDYHVSRKVDGEFTVLIFRDKQILTLNPGGTVRVGMPWQNEAAKLLTDAGVKEAIVAGELYVARDDDQRPRVHDVTAVARNPKSASDLGRLRFAVFDLVSLDGDTPPAFLERWTILQKLFDKGDQIHLVEAQQAKDSDAIGKIFKQWVEEEGAEGLVVRSDTAGTFKVKLRHTLDAAVIGFTESTEEREGMLHDMLLAVVRQDGTLQVLSRVGGGFDEDQRRNMLSDLKDMVVESEYVEVNKDHVAYQMVQPEWVVEISCLDMISQTTRGGPVNRMVLEFSDNGSRKYNVIRRLPLAAIISPQFIRRREDKQVVPSDVRIDQVTNLVEVPFADRDAREMMLPKSEIMRREIYTKEMKGLTMVRKFVMWKTNKETSSDEFPAFVVHYSDFSPNRKSALSRDIRVSSSSEQIATLWDELIEGNIKKGWNLHTDGETSDTITAQAESPAKSEASKTKKASTKTKTTNGEEKPKAESPTKSSTKKKATKTATKKVVKKKTTDTKKTAAKKTATDKTATKKTGGKKTPSGKKPATKKSKKTKK